MIRLILSVLIMPLAQGGHTVDDSPALATPLDTSRSSIRNNHEKAIAEARVLRADFLCKHGPFAAGERRRAGTVLFIISSSLAHHYAEIGNYGEAVEMADEALAAYFFDCGSWSDYDMLKMDRARWKKHLKNSPASFPQ